MVDPPDPPLPPPPDTGDTGDGGDEYGDNGDNGDNGDDTGVPAYGRPDARREVLVERTVVLAAFALSRVLYGVAGVRYDTSSLLYSSQLLDSTWLRDRLLESIWYLHAQPPAFNLFVGLVLRWSPFTAETTFHLAYLALGVVLALASHDVARRLGAGRVVAVVVALVVSCSPTTVLYESWLSYEYPVATALVVLVDLAVRFGERRRLGALVGATAVAALVVLTRSMMSPLWLLVVFACLAAYRWPPRWTAVAWAAVPLVVVLGFVVKNQLVFGTPQLSSWFGYNLDKVVTSPLTNDQKRQLADEGFTRTDPGPCTGEHPDVPALAEEYKPTPPPPGEDPIENFNQECLVAKYEALQSDAVAVTRAHPGWVARNVVGAAEIWASPASLSPFVYENRQAVAPVDDVWRRVVLLDVAWDPPVAVPTAWPVGVSAPDRRFHLSLVLVVATAVVTVGGLVAVARWRRRDARSLALAVGGLTVGYTAVVAIVFEYGENNRIRFVAEPLTIVLFAVILTSGVRAVRNRWRVRQPG